MCITRVGKVLSVAEGKVEVEFFDGKESGDVDASLLQGVKKGAFVEVFGNLALSLLSVAEAKRRKALWKEVMKAAAVGYAQGGRES